MHDDGLAQHVVECRVLNPRELRQRGGFEGAVRIAGARLGEQPLRRVVADGGETMGAEPADLAATAAADIGGAPRLEEPLDQRMQVAGRRLFVPILGEGGGVAVVAGQRFFIHRAGFQKKFARLARMRWSTGTVGSGSGNAWPVIVSKTLT